MLLLPVMLTGCASILSGQNQKLTIDTYPIQDAQCVLVNDDGRWVVPSTPAKISVDKSYSDLKIACQAKGYSGNKQVESKSNGMILGNIIMPGGLIGSAIDMQTGAAYDYPETILVSLEKF